MPKFLNAEAFTRFYDALVADVDLGACKVRINQGKGPKVRYVLFGKAFGTALRTHIASHGSNRYLFQARRNSKYAFLARIVSPEWHRSPAFAVGTSSHEQPVCREPEGREIGQRLFSPVER